MIDVASYNDEVTCVKTASPLGDQAIIWVYAYHVGDTLFDAGCSNAAEELREFASKHPVKRVFITHLHEDHYGGCTAFLPEAEIFAGPLTVEGIKNPPELPEFFKLVWGQPSPLDIVQPMPSEFTVGKFTFEVIDLPGHSEEMVGFWEAEQGWLFSSDAVPLPSRKQMSMPEENIPKMIATMEQIQKLKVKVLFDGHRGPIEEPADHIQTRIGFLQDLQQRVQELATQGNSIDEIQKRLSFPAPWYLPNTEGRIGINHLIKSLLFDKADD